MVALTLHLALSPLHFDRTHRATAEAHPEIHNDLRTTDSPRRALTQDDTTAAHLRRVQHLRTEIGRESIRRPGNESAPEVLRRCTTQALAVPEYIISSWGADREEFEKMKAHPAGARFPGARPFPRHPGLDCPFHLRSVGTASPSGWSGLASNLSARIIGRDCLDASGSTRGSIGSRHAAGRCNADRRTSVRKKLRSSRVVAAVTRARESQQEPAYIPGYRPTWFLERESERGDALPQDLVSSEAHSAHFPASD